MSKAYIKAQGLVRHVHREKQVRAQAPASCACLPSARGCLMGNNDEVPRVI